MDSLSVLKVPTEFEVTRNGEAVLYAGYLSYDVKSPLEVRAYSELNFNISISRDLLLFGSLNTTGIGSVQVTPVSNRIAITLNNSNEQLRVIIKSSTLVSFLKDTCYLSPFGWERIEVPNDISEIRDFLR